MQVKEYMTKAKSPVFIKEFRYFKKEIFEHTLRWEGGSKLHKVKGDSGGWTLYGIAYTHNRDLFKNFDDFKDTTYDEAAGIAFIKYYRKAQCDRLPDKLKLIHFDTAYNMGVYRAVLTLQNAAGVTQDGIIGKQTLKAVKSLSPEDYAEVREDRYLRLVQKNTGLVKFLFGWFRRVRDILKKSK